MKERLAAVVMALSLLLVFAVAQPASAQNPSPSRQRTPTPAGPTATATPQPLFVDTASEGYSCGNGVCTFPAGNVSTFYTGVITSGGGQGPTPYSWSVVGGSLPAGLSLTPSYGVYSA